ncbi:MAG: 8-oxo-dGTP pyrophosphatase MutT (NUDIX family) [Granulosicoccus sp.]|jgi:8-oxo-dGTP pyrophosphatase MutT (NUDIX family)
MYNNKKTTGMSKMTNALQSVWEEVLRPMFLRPKRVQVAALCYRETRSGKDVLLITSRDTGRWIVPKGWPIKGLNGSEAALREAWEEAGVKHATVNPTPVGQYDYVKGLDTGGKTTVRTQVYLAEVKSLEADYPEADERSRKWVAPKEAANMVQEPELQAILRAL